MTIFLVGFVLGVIVGALILATLIFGRKPEIVATHIVYTDKEGNEMTDVILHVGDEPVTKYVAPRNDAGVLDTTVTDLANGYGTFDSGKTTADDGSSSFTFDPTTKALVVSQLGTPSALGDDGNPVASIIETDLDADSGPGKALIKGQLRVIVLAKADDVIATVVNYEDAPPA
jgi:hypothetical protein